MMPWTGEQQRLLQAMGYVLYVQAPGAAAMPSSPAAMASTSISISISPDCSRLLRSLQLAAPGHDISALVADIAALRGDATAKRALWPELRALKRAAGTGGNMAGARAAH